jgi:E3 ubiquitin-protein ligase SHPRH
MQVESTATKAAMMALQLTTRHRWCVTGTPVQRGLEDLYGLFLFLQASPFDNKFWWHNAIQTPYEKVGEGRGKFLECIFSLFILPLFLFFIFMQGIETARDRLHNFLKPIMWRNTKVDVADELQLPEQLEKEVNLLRFSAVESTFYRKQHEECSVSLLFRFCYGII